MGEHRWAMEARPCHTPRRHETSSASPEDALATCAEREPQKVTGPAPTSFHTATKPSSACWVTRDESTAHDDTVGACSLRIWSEDRGLDRPSDATTCSGQYNVQLPSCKCWISLCLLEFELVTGAGAFHHPAVYRSFSSDIRTAFASVCHPRSPCQGL